MNKEKVKYQVLGMGYGKVTKRIVNIDLPVDLSVLEKDDYISKNVDFKDHCDLSKIIDWRFIQIIDNSQDVITYIKESDIPKNIVDDLLNDYEIIKHGIKHLTLKKQINKLLSRGKNGLKTENNKS